MVGFVLVLFVIAASFSVYSTVSFLLDHTPSLAVVLGRTGFALVAFGLFVGVVMKRTPDPVALYGMVVFAVVALGGGLLRFVPHASDRSLPKPVLLLQSLGAFVGYGLVIYSFLK